MTEEERINELLSEWHKEKARGIHRSAADLCREFPALTAALQDRMDRSGEPSMLRPNTDTPTNPPQTPVPGAIDADRNHSDLSQNAATPDLGSIGGYRLLQILGEGGMGRVYRAEEVLTGRQVALKVIKPVHAEDEILRQRFLREAQLAAQIDHLNVVSIYYVGQDAKQIYLVMPLLQGQTLAASLRDSKPTPIALVLSIGRQVAQGLAAAHERGLIHRDIKPANIWLESSDEEKREARGNNTDVGSTSGVFTTSSVSGVYSVMPRVKILDFGLARSIGQMGLTHPGDPLGTPGYMAPEQIAGDDLDPRADLFSLGAVLYQLATGQAAFRGKTYPAILLANAEDNPPSPILVNPAMPAALSQLITRLMAKRRVDRPDSASEVVQALRRIEEQLPGVGAGPPGDGAPEDQPNLGMALAELQRILTGVEPAAVLVAPRVLDMVLRHVFRISAIAWRAPHASSWSVNRQTLFRHVDQETLALAPDQVLPATVMLLAWPLDEEWKKGNAAGILLKTWRQLFHASLHRAFEQARQKGQLSDDWLQKRIQFIGIHSFEEIQRVLEEEHLLTPAADEEAIFIEFAAVFLELSYFAPSLVASFFPCLENPEALRSLLESDVQAVRLMKRTRLPGAPDPLLREEHLFAEATEYFRELTAESEQARRVGNLVRAAIERQRAARVAPSDKADSTRQAAIDLLEELLGRFQRVLALTLEETDGWRRLLPVLLDKADQGSNAAEAALLFDLQRVCLDHESELYAFDIGGWLTSLGKTPVRRSLPCQRLVRIARTLRSATRHLNAARLSDKDRRDLNALLQSAVQASERQVRQRFRPVITSALHDVGLEPAHPLEETAFRKIVEEFLDRIIAAGFVTFSDLRDTISRNQLKLPDLNGPMDFIEGDSLQRLDRRLAALLDGVYRPSDIYMRVLARFTALNFGTPWGRQLTRFITMPLAGGIIIAALLLIILAKLHVVDAVNDGGDEHPFPYVSWPAFYGLWAACALPIFALLHFTDLRYRVKDAIKAFRTNFVAAVLSLSRWLSVRLALKLLIDSWLFQLIFCYALKPAVVCSGLFWLFPALVESWAAAAGTFLVVNVVINSRPGVAIWDMLRYGAMGLVELMRAGLLPALVGFIAAVFRQIMHAMEALLFRVDEWLLFRGEGSSMMTAARCVLGVIWSPIAYLFRFNYMVLIEPGLHPLKLPISLVAAKFTILSVPLVRADFIAALSPMTGYYVAEAFSAYLLFWGLPDAIAFICWEIKENWTLYRANRDDYLGPVVIGAHGETMPRLFLPGFHSGTLPKLFAKTRRAERDASHWGNWSGVRAHHAERRELEQSVRTFVERELCVLLEQTPTWKVKGLTVGKVRLATNSVQVALDVALWPGEPLVVEFAVRQGWIVARIAKPGWTPLLSPPERTLLQNALAILYVLAGVDLVHEHIAAISGGTLDSIQFHADGITKRDPASAKQADLAIPADSQTPMKAALDGATVVPRTASIAYETLKYSKVRLRHADCERCWRDPSAAELLVPDWPFLPPVPAKS